MTCLCSLFIPRGTCESRHDSLSLSPWGVVMVPSLSGETGVLCLLSHPVTTWLSGGDRSRERDGSGRQDLRWGQGAASHPVTTYRKTLLSCTEMHCPEEYSGSVHRRDAVTSCVTYGAGLLGLAGTTGNIDMENARMCVWGSVSSGQMHGGMLGLQSCEPQTLYGETIFCVDTHSRAYFFSAAEVYTWVWRADSAKPFMRLLLFCSRRRYLIASKYRMWSVRWWYGMVWYGL